MNTYIFDGSHLPSYGTNSKESRSNNSGYSKCTSSSNSQPNSETVIINGFMSVDSKNNGINTLHKYKLVVEVILFSMYLLTAVLSFFYLIENFIINENDFNVLLIVNSICNLLIIYACIRLIANIVQNLNKSSKVKKNKITNVIYIAFILSVYTYFYLLISITSNVNDNKKIIDTKKEIIKNLLKVLVAIVIFILLVVVFMYWRINERYCQMHHKSHKHGILK